MLIFMVYHQKLIEIENLKKKIFLINAPSSWKRVVRQFCKKKNDNEPYKQMCDFDSMY